MNLKDKVVIVTGAGRGIGRGIAEVFSREGANVVIATLEPEGAELAEQLGGSFVQTDVSEESSIQHLIAHTLETYGRIDSLVNNAGITVFKPLLEASLADWEQLINIDLRGPFLCSKYAAAEMLKTGGGTIINISSNHALATMPNAEMYAAAKGGINAMTRSMALSLGQYNIRVNAICPGFTSTPHYYHWVQNTPQPQETEAAVLNLHATKRICQPQDIGELAAFIASDKAKALTGEIIIMDNGMTARLYNAEGF